LRVLLLFISLPFLLTMAFPTNLLGIDPKTVRHYFLMPVRPGEIIRVRLAAARLFTWLLTSEMIAVGLFKGNCITGPDDAAVVLLFTVSLSLIVDTVGTYVSIAFPVPVTWGRAMPKANQVGAFLTLGAVVLVLGGCQLMLTLQDRVHVPGLTAAAWLALVVLLFWVQRGPQRAWVEQAMVERRDRVLRLLEGAL